MTISHGLIWLVGLAALYFGFLSIQKRIRRQEQMQKELEETQLSYRTVADFTYDWEYWIGPKRELLYVSPSCKRITGYSAEEFLADRPQDLLEILIADVLSREGDGLIEKALGVPEASLGRFGDEVQPE